MAQAATSGWLRRLHRVEDLLLAGLLLVLVALACSQILLRTVFDTGFTGSEAAARTLVLWVAMLGALAATRERRHLAIDALPRLLPPALRRACWMLTQLFAAFIAGALAWYCGTLLAWEVEAPTPLFAGLPSWVGMLILPPGFALMSLRFLLSSVQAPPADPVPAANADPRIEPDPADDSPVSR